MKEQKLLPKDELEKRAMRFFSRYGKELEQIRELLRIKLSQLALAYTIEKNLPQEAITVHARVKTLESFLKKLSRKGWPQYYYPTEICQDLIGARITCWFVDDCYGILEYINSSSNLKVVKDSLEDYVKSPKPSGYRGLHILCNTSYDSVQQVNGSIAVIPEDMICEIQIRTKLQDAWGDITHEFHYKAKEQGVEDDGYEGLLADIAERLASEDKTFIKFRNVYQKLADKKQKEGKRTGFLDDGN